MKKSIFALIFFLTLFSQSLFARPELCVLSFERRDFPASLGLKKIFKNYPDVHVVIEATPQDLTFCVKNGFEEIILVGHALVSENESVNLVYFQELLGKNREDLISSSLTRVEEALKAAKTKKEKKKLLKLQNKISNFPDSTPLYGAPMVMMNRFFESLKKDIQTQKSEGTLRLRKLRVMTCERGAILKRYSFFQDLSLMGIELDMAPVSKIGSLIKGRQVTNFNYRWVKKSL